MSEGRSATPRDGSAYIRLLERTAAATTSDTLEVAAATVLAEICRFTGWPVGRLHRRVDGGPLEATDVWHLDDPAGLQRFPLLAEATTPAGDRGLVPTVVSTGRPGWVTGGEMDPGIAGAAAELGLRSAIGLPVRAGTTVEAVLEFFSTSSSGPEAAVLDVVADVGAQLGRVVERQRATSALRQSEERLRALAQSYERQLAERGLRDHLTGLPNRVLLLDRLELALSRAGRERSSVAVVVLDLDGFMTVNDGMGHHVGDELLRAVAGRLQRRIRPGDTVARTSGDEFAVILEDLEDRDEAVQLARYLLTAFDQPFDLTAGSLSVTASAGVTMGAGGTAEPGPLLSEAGAALHRARQRGPGGTELFDEQMRTAAARRQATEHDLREAMGGDQFVLHYQPIVALGTGEMFGAEALVRWQHPTRGLLPPGEFVPVAEETGLIVPLGQWVLAAACRQIVEWQAVASRRIGIVLSVNVSSHQFQQAEWTEEVAQALGDADLAPEQLVIEITESTLIENMELAALRLKELRRLGVRVAIDDFGTGYSSLGYLRHLPVDILKIDKSFIDGITGGPHESALARAVLKLARTLGLQTVAEGVEQHEQLVVLRRLGCQLGQGFHLGRPEPPEAVAELLS